MKTVGSLPRVLQQSRQIFRSFAGRDAGSVAMTFGIAASVLLAAGGMAIDIGIVTLKTNQLQRAADAGALAAARELQVANATEAQVIAVATETVQSNLQKYGASVNVSVVVGDDKRSVSVKADLPVKTFFMDWTEGEGVAVDAVAGIHNAGIPLCVLGLSQRLGGVQKPGVTLNENARLSGDSCAVYSNATRRDAIRSDSGALLEAGLICSSGGAMGGVDNFNPAPITDCPIFKDPLAGRPEPTIGSCDYTNVQHGFDAVFNISERMVQNEISAETYDESGNPADKRIYPEKEQEPVDTSGYDRSVITLEPGVYCGGLVLGGGVTVNLRAGDYIIKDGPLYITQEAILQGENVGFFFSGDDSNIYFGPHTQINLTAPESGDLAGLLFFESRTSRLVRPHAILSDGARRLEGTIYLPTGHLYIDADAPIADKSAYTAIIANRVELFAGPHLVLNTDYTATEVPVPDGVGATKGDVHLTK